MQKSVKKKDIELALFFWSVIVLFPHLQSKKGTFLKFVVVLFVSEYFIKIWPLQSESATKVRMRQCLVVIPNYKILYLKYN